MGAMKKLFLTCILVGTCVPLFQNCGQQGALHGNGDPYESDPVLDIGDDFNTELPGSPVSGTAPVVRSCTPVGSGGKISKVIFQSLDAANNQIRIITTDSKERSVIASSSSTSVTMDLQYDSGIRVKRVDIFAYSVTLYVEKSGVTTSEQLSCVFP